MIRPFPFEPILHYLYRILDIDPGEFSRRPQEIWPALYQLSSEEMIALYFIAWSYENWKEYFPEKMQNDFKEYLFKNQSRNIFLQSEIVHLAKIFKDAEIPIMFLKGSAGLIRGLYPLSLRFISDIDALVPMNKIEPSRELLVSRGFVQTRKQTSYMRHHHIEPYYNPAYPGEIEIHFNPYNLSCLKKTEMPDIWDNAEIITCKHEEVIVPSITDHAWILMRTDMLTKAFLPRIRDVIEMYQIQQKGYRVDFQLINKRSDKDNISNAVKGMSYACSKYMGLKPLVPCDSLFVKWEEWTLKQKRKIMSDQSRGDQFPIYCAGIRFLPSGKASRIRLIMWLSRHHHRICFRIVLRRLLLITRLLKPAKQVREYLKKIF